MIDHENEGQVMEYNIHNGVISSHHFRDINIFNLWPWKFMSRSPNISFALVLFDGKYQHL